MKRDILRTLCLASCVFGFATTSLGLTVESFTASYSATDGKVTLNWKLSGEKVYNVAVSRSETINAAASEHHIVEPLNANFTQSVSEGSIQDEPPKTGTKYYYWLHVSKFEYFEQDFRVWYLYYDNSWVELIASVSGAGPIEVNVGEEPKDLPAPQNVQVVSEKDSNKRDEPLQFIMTWDAVEGATSYEWECSYTDGENFKSVYKTTAKANQVSFTWSGLPEPNWPDDNGSIPRYYRVYAKDNARTSEPSAVATWAYTPPAFPGTLCATGCVHTTGTLLLSWERSAEDPLPHHLWYTLARWSSEKGWEVVATVQDVTHYEDSGFGAAASKGEQVFYKVIPGHGTYAESAELTTHRRFGVFVGVDHYAAGWCKDLEDGIPAATGIAARYKPENDYHTLTDAAATKANVEATCLACSSVARPGDMFIYFHSSHGIHTSNNQYVGLSLYDENTEVTPSDLSGYLNKFPEGVAIAVVLDSCYSGVMKDEINKVSPLTHPSDIGWITSTDNYAESTGSEKESFGNTGILNTGWVLGCADTGPDGYVTMKELGDYAKKWYETCYDIYNAKSGVYGDVLASMVVGACGVGRCPALDEITAVTGRIRGSGFELKWDEADGATGYYIYGKTGDGDIVKLGKVNHGNGEYMKIERTSLIPSTQYTYYVKPYNDALVGHYKSVTLQYVYPTGFQDYITQYYGDNPPEGLYNENGSLSPSVLATDSDGDNFNLYSEFVAGTDPTDPKSVFTLTQFNYVDGKCKITWSPDLGSARKYTMQEVDVSGGEYTDPNGKCYRVVVDMPW